MRKKILIIICVSVIAGLSVVGILLVTLNQGSLPIGEDPVLVLPYEDESHLYEIQGYGDSLGFPHNGIDFIFNNSVQIICPHAGVIQNRTCWYNPRDGGSWQTLVCITLNTEYLLQVIFESQATDETNGTAQGNAVVVSLGQQVTQNQTLGTLLKHGDHARLHFGFVKDTCPYNYLSPAAKVRFDAAFAKYNITYAPCT